MLVAVGKMCSAGSPRRLQRANRLRRGGGGVDLRRPHARGQGVGTGLLEQLARRAGELGYWKLTGKLFPENEASVRLVRRNGWREVGLHLRHAQLEGRWRDVL